LEGPESGKPGGAAAGAAAMTSLCNGVMIVEERDIGEFGYVTSAYLATKLADGNRTTIYPSIESQRSFDV
jgi:hypothetical protein